MASPTDRPYTLGTETLSPYSTVALGGLKLTTGIGATSDRMIVPHNGAAIVPPNTLL